MPSLTIVPRISRALNPVFAQGVRAKKDIGSDARKGPDFLGDIRDFSMYNVSFSQKGEEPLEIHIMQQTSPLGWNPQEKAMSFLVNLWLLTNCSVLPVTQNAKYLEIDLKAQHGCQAFFTQDNQKRVNAALVFTHIPTEAFAHFKVVQTMSAFFDHAPYAVAFAAEEGRLGDAQYLHNVAFFWGEDTQHGLSNLEAHFNWVHKRLLTGRTTPEDRRCGFYTRFNQTVLDAQLADGLWQQDVELVRI